MLCRHPEASHESIIKKSTKRGCLGVTAECFHCGAPAVKRFGNGWLCEGCIPGRDADCSDEPTGTDAGKPSGSSSNESETPGGGGTSIPTPLDDLGEVFVPIERARSDTSGLATPTTPTRSPR